MEIKRIEEADFSATGYSYTLFHADRSVLLVQIFYLSDARKTAQNKLKTIVRHPIRGK